MVFHHFKPQTFAPFAPHQAEVTIPEPKIPDYFGKIPNQCLLPKKNITMATGSSHHWVICKVTSALHNLHTQFRVTFCPGTCPGFVKTKQRSFRGALPTVSFLQGLNTESTGLCHRTSGTYPLCSNPFCSFGVDFGCLNTLPHRVFGALGYIRSMTL